MKTLTIFATMLLSTLWLGGSALGQDAKHSGGMSDKKLISRYSLDQFGQRNIGRGINMYSPREEMELGEEMSEQVEQSAHMIKDEALESYLNSLGQRLGLHSEANTPLRFKIIDSDEVNAFSLPNGMVYVNSGLILMANNEAELAGVLSHEIAHVACHHGVRTATKQQLLGLGNLAVMMLTGGVSGMVAKPASGIGAQALSFKFDRDAEREADVLGLEYTYLSGYDPQAFVSIMERIGEKDAKRHGRIERAFATHPETVERVAQARRVIALLLPTHEDYVLDSSDFLEARKTLAALQGRIVSDDQLPRPKLRHIPHLMALAL